VAYALVSGLPAAFLGDVRVSVSGVSFSEARNLGKACGKEGITGVYQRSFADRTLEMDVTAGAHI
jgi:hypothetical protein